MPSPQSIIRRIAAQVRRDRERLGECPRGRCIDWTLALVEALRAGGFPAVRAYGVIHPDGYWAEGGTVVFSGESWNEDWVNHNWAMVGDLVIDIGADQFNPILKGRKFPPVFVRRIDRAPRHALVEVVLPR